MSYAFMLFIVISHQALSSSSLSLTQGGGTNSSIVCHIIAKTIIIM
jgi:hypothetical protein